MKNIFRARPSIRAACASLLILMIAACSDEDLGPDLNFERPATAVSYEVELTGAESEIARTLMEQALEVFRKQEDGAQSVAFLRRRAQGDVATAQKILRSFGYYEAEVDVDIDELPPEDVVEEGEPASRALARIIITQGRRYTLAEHRFNLVNTGPGNGPRPPDNDTRPNHIGSPANAARILRIEDAVVDRLRATGRPYAERTGRDAVADTETAEIEVETTINTGRAYVFGDVTYEGADSVDREYLNTYLTFKPGERAEPEKLIEFQRALIATGLFNVGNAALPDDPPEGRAVPVTVTLEEAPPQTIGGGILYDTDAGPAVTGEYEHRNLFGSNETITLEALVGLEEQSLDTRYRVPQFGQPKQDLVFGLELRRIDDQAFDEIGGTFAAGLEREISPELTIGAGGLVELSRLQDVNGTRTSKLFGAPIFAAFDNTDDRLDPSKGIRARVSATPFAGYVGSTPAAFAIIDSTISTYFDLTGRKKYILAARGRVASALSGSEDVVAANRRLFSGGGGSVRGYGERFIGPLDADGDPTGGLSAVELGLEMRARVTRDIGIAGFVEAGSVSTEVAPVLDEGVQIAVGAGVRYFSPIGPLRLDVGVPVNPRNVDDAFQVYISIGQAF